MGFSDVLSDFYRTLTFTEVHAEAPPSESDDSDEAQEGEEKSSESNESSEAVEEEAEAEAGEEAEEGESGEEEEEEEAEEPEDIKPKLEAECAESAQCYSVKHHFDECAERVTAAEADPDHKGPKEDCVEEFFHLTHCVTQCAAPKLFRQLK